MTELKKLQRIAESLALEAGSLGNSYYRRLDQLEIEHKGSQDLVSEADRAVETHLRQAISHLFPEDGFLGEEFEFKAPQTGGGTWVVDPIDGTWCFLNGIASWCVSIAFVAADGATSVGVIYDPNSGEMFSAARGCGAKLNGLPIHVKPATSLHDGSMSIGFSTRMGPEHVVPVIDRVLQGGGVYHRHGSGALAMAWTAAGRLIGYMERHMNSWDCLAGLLLIEEAGGWARKFLNNEGMHKGNAVVAGPATMRHILEDLTRDWDDERP